MPADLILAKMVGLTGFKIAVETRANYWIERITGDPDIRGASTSGICPGRCYSRLTSWSPHISQDEAAVFHVRHEFDFITGFQPFQQGWV